MNLTLMKGRILHVLISSLTTPYITNWFYCKTLIFFFVSKQVPNGHTYHPSCAVRVLGLKIPYTWGSVLKMNHTLMQRETLHKLISNWATRKDMSKRGKVGSKYQVRFGILKLIWLYKRHNWDRPFFLWSFLKENLFHWKLFIYLLP